MSIGNWYRVGTVSVQNGSVNVVGTNSFWSTQANPGDRFTVDGETWYEIVAIADDTHMAIEAVGGSGAFAGATAANLPYAIDRNFNNALSGGLAAQVAALLAQFQASANGPLSGLFQNGSAATPGMAFLNEASTGWFRPAAGIAALAVQGAEFLRAVGSVNGVPAMLALGTAAPAQLVDLASSSSALWGVRMANGSAGTAARAAFIASNGAQSLNVGVNGANFTARGVLAPARGFVEAASGIDFACGATAGNAFTWGTGTGYASRMVLDFAGNLGLGTMPAAPVHVVNGTVTGAGQIFYNMRLGLSGGTSQLANGTGVAFDSWINGGSRSVATIASYLVDGGNGGTAYAGGLVFETTNTTDNGPQPRVRIDPAGNLLVNLVNGTTSAIHQIQKAVPMGTSFLNITTSSIPASTAIFAAVGSGNYGSTATGIFIGVNTTTQRSLNLGGSVNGPGVDYAEYRELVPALYGGAPGAVPAGALLGYDASGLMTNVFANVVGRVLPKSTNPSIVGGDIWGQQDAITAVYGIAAPGDQPSTVSDPGPGATPDQAAAYAQYQADEAAYQARLAAFNVALETERAKWDRIALCGVVPVNITGLAAADVGKYLVPCAAPDGTITATAVARSALTLGQYIDSFGTIEKIGPDGRPLVNVKNG